MQLLTLSSSRPRSGGELPEFEMLAGTLSSRFARLQVEEVGPAIEGALQEMARAIVVEGTALIEFGEGGTASEVHTWPIGVPPISGGDPPVCLPRWLVD